jgi:hypothetical protein
LTAANFRKKHLLHGSKNEDFHILLQREMVLLDSVLSSPLHRQSKSPTLWYHRYWLISIFFGQMCPGDEFVENFLNHEISIILRSAERHQHNYYAWQYARRLIKLLAPVLAKNKSTDTRVKTGLMDEIFAWCLQHPSDTSGWSCLLFLMQQSTSNTQQVTLIMHKTADFASSVRWKKEALGHFLRTTLLLTNVVPEDIRTKLIDTTRATPIGSLNSKFKPSE